MPNIEISVPDGEFVLPNKGDYTHSLRENGAERNLTPDEAEGLCAMGYIHRCEEHSTPDTHVYHTHASQTWEEIETVIKEIAVPDEHIPVKKIITDGSVIAVEAEEIEVSEFDSERKLFVLDNAPISGEGDEYEHLWVFDRVSLFRLSFDAPDSNNKPRLQTQKWLQRLLDENPCATVVMFFD